LYGFYYFDILIQVSKQYRIFLKKYKVFIDLNRDNCYIIKVAYERLQCSLKTEQQNVNVLNFSLFKKDNEQVKHFLESLILAQDERWRRA
jgi:hypothetical protein